MFLLQYRAGPKVRRKTIGAWGESKDGTAGLTAAQARKLAEQARGEVRGGGDPVARLAAEAKARLAAEADAKRAAVADAFTVGVLIRQWQSLHLAERSPSYRAEAPKRLRAALSSRVGVSAAKLTRAAAVQAVDAVKATQGPVAANRVRAYGRACFGWAVKRGTIDGSPFAAIPKPSKETSRDRVLSDEEIGRVWRACDRLAEPWRSIFRLLLLTGQRRGEVAGMAWSELSEDRETWRLSADRTKNGRAHDVPISRATREIIAAVPRVEDCPLVFSRGHATPPSGFGKPKASLDQYIAESGGAIPPWVLHDMRRTVATGLQRLGIRLEVTEACLNHISGASAGIVAVYQRHNWATEKRDALDKWVAHVVKCGQAAAKED